jgi:arylsulfatase
MQPNLILITADQLRADGLGCFGSQQARTPWLDHLASKGLAFRNARTSCPLCIPARRSLLSGLHPATHGTITNTEGEPFRPPATLPGLLRTAGYQTQLVGKFHVSAPGERLGFDNVIQSETPNDRRASVHQRRNDYADWFAQVSDAPHTLYQGVMSNDRTSRPWTLPEHHHHSNWVTEEATRFLGTTRDPSCPFFLHLSYWAPHQPAIPPQCYYDRYADNDWTPSIGSWVPQRPVPNGLALDAQRGPFSLRDMRDHAQGYFGLINHIDDLLNGLVDRWRSSRMWDRERPTWVIVTSDHGEQLGEHHMFRKSAPYEGSLRIPLIIAPLSGTRVDRPRLADDLVGLEDILPTCCTLAGLPIPAHLGAADGRDLTPALNGAAIGRDFWFSEGRWQNQHHQSCVTADGRKYIRWSNTGEEQAFDLGSDPHECVDHSGDWDLSALRAASDTWRSTAISNAGKVTESLTPCANAAPQAVWA